MSENRSRKKRTKPTRIVRHRLAELVRANQALRDVNARLARETNYAAILSVLLGESVSQMEAVDAAAFRYEPKSACLYIIGAVLRRDAIADVPDHPYGDASRPCPVAHMALWKNLRPGEVHVSKIGAKHPNDGIPAVLFDWHTKRNHKLVLRASLAVGTIPIGWIGVSFDRDVVADEKLLEIFRTLSEQVTLVLHLMKLSDSANENAAKLAVVGERHRIALEMHDTLAHSFTGILMQLEAAQELISSNGAESARCLAKARAIARQGLRQARQTLSALQDSNAERLTKSLPRLIADFYGRDAKTECSFSVRGVVRALPAEVERQGFRICQESIGNAQRYANATRIDLTLEFTATGVVVTVQDDGIGFTQKHVKELGFGLSGMQRRAERIGASLEIDSALGKGTRIILNWREQGAHSQRY